MITQIYAPEVQMEERRASNANDAGSSPVRGTIYGVASFNGEAGDS